MFSTECFEEFPDHTNRYPTVTDVTESTRQLVARFPKPADRAGSGDPARGARSRCCPWDTGSSTPSWSPTRTPPSRWAARPHSHSHSHSHSRSNRSGPRSSRANSLSARRCSRRSTPCDRSSLRSLHSTDVGGSWVQLPRDLPELAAPFRASAAELGIPLQHGTYDALYWENPSPAVHVLPPPDNSARLAAGSENIGASTAIVEVPIWASDLAEDLAPHPDAGHALRDLADLVLDGGRQVTAVLEKARAFLPPPRHDPGALGTGSPPGGTPGTYGSGRGRERAEVRPPKRLIRLLSARRAAPPPRTRTAPRTTRVRDARPRDAVRGVSPGRSRAPGCRPTAGDPRPVPPG